jgi:surface polysaccharide O-acyltransferase-like enzyme
MYLRKYLAGTLNEFKVSVKTIVEYLITLLLFTCVSLVILVIVFHHTGAFTDLFSQHSTFAMHYLCMTIVLAVAIPLAEHMVRMNIALSHIKDEKTEVSEYNFSESLPSKKNSLIHIEVLRIICCYLVMFNHTGTMGFFLFSIARSSKLYWLYMFMSIACKVAVPVFFMISGALLLGKEESIKDIFIKRIFRFIIILIAISTLYRVYDCILYNGEFSLIGCFKMIYSSKASTALWYLYSYIGMLMMLPFLRKMVRLMKITDYLYLAAGHICLVGIIPILQYYLSAGTWSLSGYFSSVLFTTSNIFFVITGYFVENVLNKKYFNWKNAITLIILSILSIVISCLMTQYQANLTGELSEGYSQSFHGSLTAIPAFTMYYCSKMLFTKIKTGTRVRKFIQFAGSTTFGVFLLERILRERLVFIFNDLQPIIHAMPACLLFILACLVVGTAIVAVLKKIPIIRKYI